MKNLKRVLIVLSLICVVGLGTTYALMSSKTDTAVNTFTSSKNVKIDLREPGWDGYTFNDTLPAKPGESVILGKETDMTLGFNKAQVYQPADVITKDPTVKNTSDDTSSFVAVKVEFEGPNGKKLSRTEFKDAYGELNLAENFDEVTGTGYSLFIYKTALTPTQTATPFTKVTLNKDIKLTLQGALPTFKIKTTGYATQANIIYADAKAELTNLAK